MSSIEDVKRQLALPLIAAPMFLVSGPDLVVAACGAGIVGSFPTPNCRTIEALDLWLREITGRLSILRASPGARPPAPWAANLVVHRTNKRLEADLDLVVKYQAPIVITALGSPSRVVDAVHGYGGLVFADVNSVELARKAADCGVDGLVLVGSGAGGHTGHISAFSFVPAVRRWWDGAIIVGGGICGGSGIRAAEMLGADLAYMGTRFIPTVESLAEPDYKQMVVESSLGDLLVTKAFTGANASMLKPSIIRAGLDPAALQPRDRMNFQGQAGDEPKPWKGIWAAGQGIDMIDAIQTVEEIVSDLRADYEKYAAMPAADRTTASIEAR
jgi:nitronate monooxygenase